MRKAWMTLVGAALDLASRRYAGEDVAAADEAALLESVCELAAADATGPMAALARLALDPRELLAAWCLVAHQVDARLAARLDALGGSDDVTIGALVEAAFGGDRGAALAPLGASGTLLRYALVERTGQDASSWVRRTIRASDRLLELALSSAPLPARDVALRALVRDAELRVEVVAAAPALDQLAVDPRSLDELRRAVAIPAAIVVVSGMPGLGRRTLAMAAAREAGHATLVLDARSLARDAAVLAHQLRAFARECRLLDRVPIVTCVDALVEDGKSTLLDLVASELPALVPGLVIVTASTSPPAIRWSRSAIAVALGPITSEQRGALWLHSLGQGSASDAELLASQYPLAPAVIQLAATTARARANGRRLEPDDVYAGVRGVLDDRLGQYARRVTITQSWSDLVLSQDHADSIVELLARVRERRRVYEQWGFAAKVGKGLGISALFSGPPGTGKTMVASLIASDLGVDLYQVDLGKIVSKYIGETEKHLAALFDAAEAGHAILLFDEADSLFGKRSEVKSSNDRYANLETNYLLQRLESFTGICLLTTNHEANIDPAFQRRLSLHLRFELPDLEQRAALWRAMLPAAAPVAAKIDFHALARRYEMSGGYIRNATLRAAFLASNGDTEITAALLDRAARLEYEGMGKLAMA